MKICHITIIHQRYDIRIFHKESKLLQEAGYEANLIIADGKCDEIKDGIHIYDIGKPKNRIERLIKFSKKAYQKAISLDCEIYHFHDPELISIALKLKKKGKKVIYDVHEDVPRQILSKSYLPKYLRRIISKFFEIYENYAVKKFDYIITSTPFIKDRFLKINHKTIDVQNMPILSEFTNIEHKWETKEKALCYIGGITKIRGIEEIIVVVKQLPEIILFIAGPLENDELKKIINNDNQIKYLGFLNRDEIKIVFKKSICGLVLLHPTINYLNSLPIKLFEYMSAGLPVIASNFPLWKEIVESNNCGICVDPLKPDEIAKAIEYLINNLDIARKMGENGRKAVIEKYNWENESKKLLSVYKSLS